MTSEFFFTLNEQYSKARANDTLRHLTSLYKHRTCSVTMMLLRIGMGIVKVLTVLLLLPIPLIDPVL